MPGPIVPASGGAIIRMGDAKYDDALKGHPGVEAYHFVSGPDEFARWLMVSLDVIAPGGGIDPHYHEGLEADHAYYLADGEVVARIGDEEFPVTKDSLMVFDCKVVHGFRVVSPEGARVLRLGASATGKSTGGSVFVD